MNEQNIVGSFPPPASRTRALNWEDVIWLLIVLGLAGLWIALLMSPAWR